MLKKLVFGGFGFLFGLIMAFILEGLAICRSFNYED